MKIKSLRAEAWTLQLRTPFVVATRTALDAQNVRITIETDEPKVTGYGESAPVGYVTGESVDSVLEAVASVSEEFVGQPIDRLRPLMQRADRALFESRSARAGVEMALCDAWGKHWSLPMWQFFGGFQETVISDLTIPIVPEDEAATLARKTAADGFNHIKIKVGDQRGHDADLARIESIVKAAPGVSIRIDANQAFAPDQAVSFTEIAMKMGAHIELLEQPVRKDDIAGLKYVKERVEVPVFADEAARDVGEVIRLIREDAVDGINIKLMKSGISGALQIIALCQAAGKKLMLGCMLESRLGIAAAAHLAGGTGAFDFLDLDSQHLLAPMPELAGGFHYQGGAITVEADNPGWGVTGL